MCSYVYIDVSSLSVRLEIGSLKMNLSFLNRTSHRESQKLEDPVIATLIFCKNFNKDRFDIRNFIERVSR